MEKSNTKLKKIGLIGVASILLVIVTYYAINSSTSKMDNPSKVADKPVVEEVIQKPKTPQELMLDSMNMALQLDGSHSREINFKGVKYDVFVADLRSVKLQMHWKDSQGNLLKDINSLKNDMAKKGQKPLFVTNGGIYAQKFIPEGLYIENGQLLKGLNTKNANGNFYLKPNGVFLVTENQSAAVVKTEEFVKLHNVLKGRNDKINFAVQSGPQLLVNGKIHPKFNANSPNKYIRNGVGIFNNNSKKVVFAITQEKVNLYDFSSFFYEVMKCDDALYLDGFVSRMYIDKGSKRQDLDGNFTTMISAVKK
ncbi:MAG: phosphodiester glycosidase family protein [Saprospiraceae bacterium]